MTGMHAFWAICFIPLVMFIGMPVADLLDIFVDKRRPGCLARSATMGRCQTCHRITLRWNGRLFPWKSPAGYGWEDSAVFFCERCVEAEDFRRAVET